MPGHGLSISEKLALVGRGPEFLRSLLGRHSTPADSGCVEWSGCMTKGYGQIFLKRGNSRSPKSQVRVPIYAHRAAFYLNTGTDPDGAAVCHSCDNPRCVNPDHLWIGSQADNIADMLSKGRQHKVGEAEKQRLREALAARRSRGMHRMAHGPDGKFVGVAK